MRFLLVILGVFCCFSGCKNPTNKSIDVSNVKVNVIVNEFHKDFYNATKESLPKVKEKYPFLFPQMITDSIALSKISSKDEQELYSEVQKKYKDLGHLRKQLTSLFKHIRFYNPKFKIPQIVTIQSNIDYENRVIYADSLLLISLDVYLGKEHPFYNNYPKYIKKNNTENHLIVDVAGAIIETQISPNNNRSLISNMIHEGKKTYVLDVYLPNVSKREKLGYDTEKMEWAFANEEQIWMYFIENNFLFNTKKELIKRFIDIAPFSKFYTSADKDSPGSIGVFIGYQIVKDYMLNNDVSLQELLRKNSAIIFKNSNYKPRK